MKPVNCFLWGDMSEFFFLQEINWLPGWKRPCLNPFSWGLICAVLNFTLISKSFSMEFVSAGIWERDLYLLFGLMKPLQQVAEPSPDVMQCSPGGHWFRTGQPEIRWRVQRALWSRLAGTAAAVQVECPCHGSGKIRQLTTLSIFSTKWRKRSSSSHPGPKPPFEMLKCPHRCQGGLSDYCPSQNALVKYWKLFGVSLGLEQLNCNWDDWWKFLICRMSRCHKSMDIRSPVWLAISQIDIMSEAVIIRPGISTNSAPKGMPNNCSNV